MDEIKTAPKEIFEEYQKIENYKSGLGRLGLREQTVKNEQFYSGDQWHGVVMSGKRQLQVYNIIKRIGEYKLAVVGASPLSVRFTAGGLEYSGAVNNSYDEFKDSLKDMGSADEINSAVADNFGEGDNPVMVLDALSDYFKSCAERVKFDKNTAAALKDAFISGTGVIYTYWDNEIKTGVYADSAQTTEIIGDIAVEVLDINRVAFGDVNCKTVENQPYIIIMQRVSVSAAKAEAKAHGMSDDEIEMIKPDEQYVSYGEDRTEIDNSGKCTVLTKLFIAENKGGEKTVHAIKVTENATVRKEWDMMIRRYPLAVMQWQERRDCIYGESEVTYLIPNQISINKLLTAEVWGVMLTGMPMMTVNEDLIKSPITNSPGQIIRYTGDNMNNAIGFVNPPNFNPGFDNMIQSLISNTLQMSGANDAALGDIKPDNTSAITAVREAANMPMQMYQNRYYQFVEDIARIFAEFWFCYYGQRPIQINDKGSSFYIPFDGEKYKDLVLSVNIDVGASTLWNESLAVTTLSNMLQAGVINVVQYLERLPKGIIDDLSGLIKEKKAEQQAAEEQAQAQAMAQMQGQTNQAAMPIDNSAVMAEQEQSAEMNIDELLAMLNDEQREAFLNMPREQQLEMLQNAAIAQ